MKTDFEKADALFDQGRYEEAFNLFLCSAEEGGVHSMGRVALMYADGDGVERDYDKSIYWDLKAIENGATSSLLNLAITYRIIGDIRNYEHWLLKALEAGDGESALCLARLYQVSDAGPARARGYLELAVSHENILEEDREEARRLLLSLTT